MSASPPATRPPRPGWPVRVGLALLRSLEVTALVLALLLTPLWCSVPTDVERLARERPTTTATIERRRAAARAHDEAFALDWRWRDLDQIAVVLRRAVMMAEDFYFTSHHGVDWGQTLGAIVDNLGSGGQSMGGSTITQQLAKNLYLSPERTLRRKGVEMLIAGRLEQALSKRRIIELYLNIIELGDGIFGAEAAAQRWFGVPASALSPAQAVRLAVVLPSPLRHRPTALPPALTAHARRLLHRLRASGFISATELHDGLLDLGPP
jgi:monofunctional biosynthetic peptidoglycan transglycosylase